MPDVGVATVKLLRRAGFQVDFPEAQTCCGQPFFNSGFRDEAVKLAQHTIKTFEQYDAVVLPSGSCATMIRVEYPHLLAEWPGWHERATLLAAKTYELTEFLTEAGFEPAVSPQAKTVTYHDSCHMCRSLNIRDQPRSLLTKTGATIQEMSESDRCCGFGGLFSVKMPEISNAMSAEKLTQAAESGAEVLITSDPGCLQQLRGMNPDIPCQHIATVLEETTR